MLHPRPIYELRLKPFCLRRHRMSIYTAMNLLFVFSLSEQHTPPSLILQVFFLDQVFWFSLWYPIYISTTIYQSTDISKQSVHISINKNTPYSTRDDIYNELYTTHAHFNEFTLWRNQCFLLFDTKHPPLEDAFSDHSAVFRFVVIFMFCRNCFHGNMTLWLNVRDTETRCETVPEQFLPNHPHKSVGLFFFFLLFLSTYFFYIASFAKRLDGTHVQPLHLFFSFEPFTHFPVF